MELEPSTNLDVHLRIHLDRGIAYCKHIQHDAVEQTGVNNPSNVAQVEIFGLTSDGGKALNGQKAGRERHSDHLGCWSNLCL